MKHDGEILPLIRVGPNEISLMTTQGMKTVYDGGFDRTSHYSVFQNFGTLNMFSFTSRTRHLARKRVFAPVYSRSSIHSSRVQHILKTRTTKLTRFLLHQTSASRTGKSGHLIPRNFIRPLGTDIFTAFAFSDVEGTKFLDGLRTGANTMQDLGMDNWELWHEDKRDSFFFFESQPELKCFANLFAPHGRSIHARFEAWVEAVVEQYEARVSSYLKVESEEKENSEYGVYWRLLTYKNPATRQHLSWQERASEIMDHMGAGHDPVPCTLEFLMQKLTHHPEHQIRLRGELRSHLPRDIDARSYSQIDSLPFLNALILEALRVIETIETYQPRLVPVGGCTIEGYYLREGTVVSTQPHLMNHHPAIFPQPAKFDPDRWYV